jgi:hypothetical protein
MVDQIGPVHCPLNLLRIFFMSLDRGFCWSNLVDYFISISLSTPDRSCPADAVLHAHGLPASGKAAEASGGGHVSCAVDKI